MLFLVVRVFQRHSYPHIGGTSVLCWKQFLPNPWVLVTSKKQYNEWSGVFFTLGTSANFNFIGTQFF